MENLICRVAFAFLPKNGSIAWALAERLNGAPFFAALRYIRRTRGAQA